ncbi:hypothetical protein ABMA27_005572 [Loxostege sticticalis]|uniref:DDE Tnp4 domain-containing protein n=1 Tax=Loxostege sticticalis TaxID=481309 RepID=A0ABR3HJZ8_LOXSC
MPPVLSKRQKLALVLGGLIDVEGVDEKQTKRRTIWTKPWLLKRTELSHMNLLRQLEPQEFKMFMRMERDCFILLLNLVKPLIKKSDSSNYRESIPAEERFVATLQYLITGRCLRNLQFSTVISHQLLSKIIPETCEAIIKVLNENIRLPETEEEWLIEAEQFEKLWQFPHCLGSMDGKHVEIQKPANSGSLFFNYKGYFSIILFAIVNANYEFLYIHTGTNGSASDGGVLKSTKFYEKLINEQLNLPQDKEFNDTNIKAPYVFIGDSAFALERHIMKPFPNKEISKDKEVFNYRLSRGRRVVENAFGILSSRFQIFQRPMNVNLETIDKVVLACCYLHNFLRKKSDSYSTPELFRDGERQLHNLQQTQTNELRVGKNVREVFTQYFNGPGVVQFQEKMLNINRLN